MAKGLRCLLAILPFCLLFAGGRR